MFKKILSQPMLRHGITILVIGALCYFAYKEYSKMMERLEIIANELYKAKQEIIILKKINKSRSTRNIRLINKPNKNTIQKTTNIPKVNPIKINKQNSMERISKHLPTKTQQLQTIINTAHETFEDAKIIDINTIDEMSKNDEITYDTDSDLITDSESESNLIDSDVDDILSNNSEEIQNIENQFDAELSAEIGDVDLETELNTEILSQPINNNVGIEDDKQILKEEIEKLAKVVKKEINNQSITKIQTEIQNTPETKIFGIDTSTIKKQKPTPKEPKKRKGRKGLVTSWTAFMKDDLIEKEILGKYPDADFGQVSKIKGQIWRTYTNQQKEVYKQKARELTKLNRQQL